MQDFLAYNILPNKKHIQHSPQAKLNKYWRKQHQLRAGQILLNRKDETVKRVETVFVCTEWKFHKWISVEQWAAIDKSYTGTKLIGKHLIDVIEEETTGAGMQLIY